MNEKMTLTRMEAPAQLPVRKRIADYARVSTSSDEQLTSYEAQVKHYLQADLRQRKNPVTAL